MIAKFENVQPYPVHKYGERPEHYIERVPQEEYQACRTRCKYSMKTYLHRHLVKCVRNRYRGEPYRKEADIRNDIGKIVNDIKEKVAEPLAYTLQDIPLWIGKEHHEKRPRHKEPHAECGEGVCQDECLREKERLRPKAP
jgi:hypothetical protein